jgi:hypothetical protein
MAVRPSSSTGPEQSWSYLGHDRAVRERTPQPWDGMADDQAGVLTRRQLLGIGLTPSAATWLTRDWPQPHRGVYVTFTGPQPWLTRVWAGLLACGPGAVVAGEGALHLHGIIDRPPPRLHIAVPQDRHPDVGQVRVERRRHLAAVSLLAARPPRLRVECAVLDVAAATADGAGAVALTLAAVQHRRTTVDRLAHHLQQRPRQRWRKEIADALADATWGVHSLLEQRFRTRVLAAHGLPRAEHNAPDVEVDVWGGDRGRRYRDIRFRGYGLVIELDGESAHPWQSRHHDRRRDNRLLVKGDLTLRYGWADVEARACEAAAEIGAVLQRLDWRDRPRTCGPNCPIGTVSVAQHE